MIQISTASFRQFSFALLLLLLPFAACSQANSTTESDHDECYQNCTGLPIDAFCATDGNTYDNICHMTVAACRNQREIEYREDGPCISPEPKVEQCEQRAERILQNMMYQDNLEWNAKCNTTILKAISRRGELTVDDLIDCYLPSCDHGSYKSTQCHFVGSNSQKQDKWCWCSSDTGISIPGTFTKDVDPNYCNQRSSCHYEGEEYPDGKAFIPEHQCGVCECLDGNVTCFEDFVPDIQGRLNYSQLIQLSSLLKQFFYFENSHKNSILRDITEISSHVAEIPNDVMRQILEEWFNHYDSNGNRIIEFNHTEETAFHSHIAQFTACKHFLDHLNEVFDDDNNGGITLLEWHGFFDNYSAAADEAEATESAVGEELGRRSAPNSARPRKMKRTLEKRRKFYYFLSL